MKIKMTKDMVLEAIHNEHPAKIRAGVWVNAPTNEGPLNLDCTRCLVGSVLLSVISREGLTANVITRAALEATCGYVTAERYPTPVIDQFLGLVKSGIYMGALSVLFEGLYRNMRVSREPSYRALSIDETKRVVDKVMSLVDEHFPDTFVVDIDGAVPRKGIEVVG